MTDNVRQDSGSYKAGRGFARLLRGIFGRRNLKKGRASWRTLKDEFRAGRDAAGAEEPPARRIPHREKDPPTPT